MLVTMLCGSADLYGSNRVLAQDVEALVGLGATVRVLVAADAIRSERHLEELQQLGADVTVRKLQVFRKSAGRRALRLPVQVPVEARDSDLVVLWTLALAGYVPVLRAARIKTLVSVHEILAGWTGRGLVGITRLAHHAMAHSYAIRQWLESNGLPRSRTTVSYPVAPEQRVLDPPAGDEFTVLVAGRINDWKGQPQAVRAVRRLRQDGLAIRLNVAGGSFPGQERHLERLLEQIDEGEGVRYLGELPDIEQALSEANALLIPSQRPEPFGVVALEGWAAGRRAIAPAEGGVQETMWLVDGVTFEPRNEDAMAEQLGLVASNPWLSSPPRPDAPVTRWCSKEMRTERWEEALNLVLGGGGSS
jgi:glycosyltransferase involved in cell wall biosynthesis